MTDLVWFITIIIIIVFIVTVKDHLNAETFRMMVIAITIGWLSRLGYVYASGEGFWDLPYTHGIRQLYQGKLSDIDIPETIQDIHTYENSLSDVKMRNKDAYPDDTDRHGPRLGAPWAIDNKDVVDSVLTYSRGTYGYDPLYADDTYKNYNFEALNNDDALTRRQEYRSLINKKAVDGAVKSTRQIYDKYFAAEFDEEDSHEWWGNDAPVESEMFPY